MKTSSIVKTLIDFTPKIQNNRLVGLRYHLAQPDTLYAIVWSNEKSTMALSRIIPEVQAQLATTSLTETNANASTYQFIYINADAPANKIFALRNSIQVPSVWRMKEKEEWTFDQYDVALYDTDGIAKFLVQ